MKKLALILLAMSSSAFAANHEIQMLNSNEHGSMMFEPMVLKANVGDTVTFKAVNKSHFVKSMAIPEGAQKFASEEDQEITVTLDKEGLYVYTCPVHRSMNMNGIIQVGNDLSNRDKAEKAVLDLEKKAMTNKGRLLKAFEGIK